MKSADEVIREAEDLLHRCSVACLESHAFATLRRIEADARTRSEIVNALPCQDYGVEEVDID